MRRERHEATAGLSWPGGARQGVRLPGRYEESELLAHSIGERLPGASETVRREALLTLVDELDPAEVDELARYANRVRRARKST